MPLYEYQCETCGDVFEVIQKFSDEPLTEHQGCGGPVYRLLSAPALQFKGTGWYVTDYARKSGSNGSSRSDSGESKDGTSKDGSSKAEPSASKKAESSTPKAEK